MFCNIQINEKQGTTSLSFEKDSVWGDHKKSPNGLFFILSDYISNGSKECVFVYTKKELLYKVPLSSDDGVVEFQVFDDGRCVIVSGEYIFYMAADGSPITRKKFDYIDKWGYHDDVLWVYGPGTNGDFQFFHLNLLSGDSSFMKEKFTASSEGITKNLFWCLGDDYNGKGRLFIWSFDKCEKKNITVPFLVKKDEENEDISFGFAEAVFTGEKFYFLYENETDAICYDLSGEQTEPIQEEIIRLNEERKFKERQYRIDRALKSANYWSSRLKKTIAENKGHAEIERASAEFEKHKTILKEFGVDYSEEPSLEKTSPVEKTSSSSKPVEKDPEKKKKSLFSFFKK